MGVPLVMNNKDDSSSDEETQTDIKQFRNALSPGSGRVEQVSVEKEEERVPGSGPKTAAVPAPGTSRDAENYNMGHRRRGVALLLNHERVKGLEVRKGTAKDCSDLSQALAGLDFEVIVHQDLTYNDVKDCLQKVAEMDHSDADCLVVAVMSHGDPDIIFAKDQHYQVKELWQSFTPDKCATLAGKPKLFFIQACRGKKVDDGMLVMDSAEQDSTDGSTGSYTIPLQADILVAYATVEGHYSWRNPINGSWFIQSLCKELRVNGTSRDLLTMLTFVCRRVAIEYQSTVPTVYDMDRKKQVPTITSTLTRLVFFPSKKNEASSVLRRAPLPDTSLHRRVMS